MGAWMTGPRTLGSRRLPLRIRIAFHAAEFSGYSGLQQFERKQKFVFLVFRSYRQSMLQGKQTILDMLQRGGQQPETKASKRSLSSLIDGDFDDFAPPPPRKFSSPLMKQSQNINAPAALLSLDSKTVVRSQFSGQGSSGPRHRDEVAYPSLRCSMHACLIYFIF